MVAAGLPGFVNSLDRRGKSEACDLSTWMICSCQQVERWGQEEAWVHTVHMVSTMPLSEDTPGVVAS